MKVSELSGALLAYWVAKAEGLETPEVSDVRNRQVCQYVHHHEDGDDGWWTDYKPHEGWDIGGKIIQRERLVVGPSSDTEWIAYAGGATIEDSGSDTLTGSNTYGTGPTALIAAMRAYVTHKFGREVSCKAAE